MGGGRSDGGKVWLGSVPREGGRVTWGGLPERGCYRPVPRDERLSGGGGSVEFREDQTEAGSKSVLAQGAPEVDPVVCLGAGDAVDECIGDVPHWVDVTENVPRDLDLMSVSGGEGGDDVTEAEVGEGGGGPHDIDARWGLYNEDVLKAGERVDGRFNGADENFIRSGSDFINCDGIVLPADHVGEVDTRLLYDQVGVMVGGHLGGDDVGEVLIGEFNCGVRGPGRGVCTFACYPPNDIREGGITRRV
jgi:hypothetical protein